ncbi:MAG TPA: ketoacyl-ACP synthase III [Symbiobacteriaceae bacterium]|jgi:3-oxoacyl-[acyl-carrier-protein] synthase-3|nr:ketoacyl-ACP synthase III [Symbiobacteriaceae bacterium]
MYNVRIVSTGSYLPGAALTNEDLENLVGPLSPDLLAQVQVQTRHWLVDPETGEHRESNSDMAVKAARQALNLAGLSPEDVELLVLSTSSPDYPLPPMVTLVQDKLGLRRCATLEVRSGCSGSVAALDVARRYLEQGAYRTAVVIGSEAISPVLVPVFLGKDPDSIRVRDRLGIYSFGDGAGAVVLQAEPEGGVGAVLGSAMACVGGGRKPGMIIPIGGTNAPLTKQVMDDRLMELRVDFAASGTFTPHVLTEALTDVLQRSGVTADSIDLCIIPEGNTGYLREELERAGLLTPEWLALDGKVFENLALVGNTGSAALPLALDHAWKTGAAKSGDRLLLLAIESSKWIYAGMVLTWAAAPYLAESRA